MLLRHTPLSTVRNSEEVVVASWYFKLAGFYETQLGQLTSTVSSQTMFVKALASSPSSIPTITTLDTDLNLGTP